MRASYWLREPHGFAGKYDLGRATTTNGLAYYQARGFQRINRRDAERIARTPCVRLTLDGGEYEFIDRETWLSR